MPKPQTPAPGHQVLARLWMHARTLKPQTPAPGHQVLARLWTHARTLRIADGPDEVHLTSIAGMELARLAKL